MKISKIALKIIEEKFFNISEPAGGPGYRILHAKRVYRYLSNIFKQQRKELENVNKDAVLAGGILHDIGDLERVTDNNIDYSSQIDHSKSGAKIVKKELRKYNLQPSLINSIAEIIKNHHSYNPSNSIETKLVQDADLLDELGLINVWQMFSYSYNSGRNLEKTIDYWNEEGFKRKKSCIENCNFDFTKKIAENRLREMTNFFKVLQKENESEDSA